MWNPTQGQCYQKNILLISMNGCFISLFIIFLNDHFLGSSSYMDWPDNGTNSLEKIHGQFRRGKSGHGMDNEP